MSGVGCRAQREGWRGGGEEGVWNDLGSEDLELILVNFEVEPGQEGANRQCWESET